jgi:hypothetical protein
LIKSKNFCGRIQQFFPILSKQSSFWSRRAILSLHGPPTRARSRDQWGPFPPSGRKAQFDFGAVFRIEAGKIAEWWVTWDNLKILRALGHLPSGLEERNAQPH